MNVCIMSKSITNSFYSVSIILVADKKNLRNQWQISTISMKNTFSRYNTINLLHKADGIDK